MLTRTRSKNPTEKRSANENSIVGPRQNSRKQRNQKKASRTGFFDKPPDNIPLNSNPSLLGRVQSFSPFEPSEMEDAFIQLPEGQLPTILERANRSYKTLYHQGFLHFKTYATDIVRPSEEQLLKIIGPFISGENSGLQINVYSTTVAEEHVYCVKKYTQNHTKSFMAVREDYKQYMKTARLPMHVTKESFLDMLRIMAYRKEALMTFNAVFDGNHPLLQFTNKDFKAEDLSHSTHIPESIANFHTEFSSMLSMFTAHEEPISCNNLSVNYGPGVRVWLILNLESSHKYTVRMNSFRKRIRETTSDETDQIRCPKWLQHKIVFTDPQVLRQAGIRFTVVTQEPGDIIIAGAGCIRFGFNISFNVTTALNVCLTDFFLYIPATVEQCRCDGGAFLSHDSLVELLKKGRQAFRLKNTTVILKERPNHDYLVDTDPSVSTSSQHNIEQIKTDTEYEQSNSSNTGIATLIPPSNETCNLESMDVSTPTLILNIDQIKPEMDSIYDGDEDDDEQSIKISQVVSLAGNSKHFEEHPGEPTLSSFASNKVHAASKSPAHVSARKEKTDSLSSVKRYKCVLMNLKTNDTCHLTFKSYKQLRRHQKTLMHETKEKLNHKCKSCDKMFVNKFVLERHMASCQNTL